jgi:hypothetical protein
VMTQLKVNPAPISAIALFAGFALIVGISSPWAIAIGVGLSLLAFLLPFIRLSFLPITAYGNVQETGPPHQSAAKVKDDQESVVSEAQSGSSGTRRMAASRKLT